jgi:hypothetical protein
MRKFNPISALFSFLMAGFLKSNIVEISNGGSSVDSLYGANAITSGELTEEELALLNNDASIVDSDQTVDVKVNETETLTDENGNEIQVDDNKETDEEELDDDGTEKAKPVEDQETVEEIQKGIEVQQKGLQQAASILTEKGVDVNAIAEEYYKGGNKLSEASYAKLAEAGFPAQVVDSMIAGAVAQQSAFDNKIFELGGGKEAWKAASDWAAKNDHQAVDAFNKAYFAGDLVTASVVIKGILAGHKAAVGTRNKLPVRPAPNAQKQSSKAASVEPFATQADMVAAMSDKRYGRDAAYTKQVEARVAVS